MKLQATGSWQHPGKEARTDSGESSCERPSTTEPIQKVEWRVVGIKVWYRVNIQISTEPPSLLSNRPPALCYLLWLVQFLAADCEQPCGQVGERKELLPRICG